MKVLFLTIGDDSYPSSQARIYQFVPYLEKCNITCVVEPFLTGKMREQIMIDLEAKNPIKTIRAVARIISALIKRLSVVLTAGRYDTVLVQKDVLPFGLQYVLKLVNRNIVFEFADAIWGYAPELEKKPKIIKIFYPYQLSLFHQFLKKAKLVLTENSYLVNYIKDYTSKIEVITAPTRTDYFTPRITPKDDGRVVLGWIGSSSTTYMLEYIIGALEKIGQRYGNVEFHNIGGSPISLKNMPVKNMPWNNETIVEDMRMLDIGLMPLIHDSPANKARLGHKMIYYMSVGIPTVAQDLGLNKDVIQNDVNGYLADTEDDWVQSLSKLIEDGELRQRLGQNGRKMAVEGYDIKRWVKKYVEVLEKGRS